MRHEIRCHDGRNPTWSAAEGTGRSTTSGHRLKCAGVGEPLRHLDQRDVEDPGDLQLPVPPRILGIEAAHIRWFKLGGPDPDDLDNGLALCSLHHKLFDRGMLGLADDLAVVVSQRFSARTSQGRAVYDLHGQRLRPRPGTPLPAERHVVWHREQMFQGTALAG